MTDLPPDVRDRAAQAANKTWFEAGMPLLGGHHVAMYSVVDAVAEALVVEQPERESYEETIAVLSDPDAMEAIREGQEGVSDEFRSGPAEARVAELEAQLDRSRKIYAEFVTGQHELLATERDALKARVDLLTAALTELVTLKDGPRDENYRTHKDDAWANARAVLSATPTESEA